MAWRLARSLEILRSQVNAKWLGRSKNSDGSIGDEGHSARASDHNPDDNGVVRAIDITHDPKSGFDSYAFADLLLKKQDARIKYIISNRRIGSGPAGVQPGVWRKYTGKNPHDHHCHISVVPGAAGDDTRQWDIDGNLAPVDDVYVPPPATLRKGSSGEKVRDLQAALRLPVDGQFGPMTEAAVKEFQKKNGLVADGVVGPMTFAAMKSAA